MPGEADMAVDTVDMVDTVVDTVDTDMAVVDMVDLLNLTLSLMLLPTMVDTTVDTVVDTMVDMVDTDTVVMVDTGDAKGGPLNLMPMPLLMPGEDTMADMADTTADTVDMGYGYGRYG